MAGTGNTGPASAPQAASQQQNGTLTLKDTITFDKKLIGQSLSYPSSLGKTGSKQSFIRFKSYDFSDVQKTNDVYNIGALGTLVGNAGKELLRATTSFSTQELTYSKDTIDLYVPPGINVSYGANWGEAALGAVGAQRSAAGADVITGSLASLIGGIFQGGAEAGLTKLSEKLNNIPSFSAQGSDILGLTTGLVFNENKFSTFNSMNLRTFNYSFILVARSKDEKNIINQIINTFKIAMHPAGLTIGSSGKIKAPEGGEATFSPAARPPLLKYPKIWTIEYRIGEKTNKFLPKTKFCSLQNLALNYTPNSVFTTLTDGQVPAIQMDLSFKELTTLTADQIINPEILNPQEEKDGILEFAGTGVDDNYNFKSKGTF